MNNMKNKKKNKLPVLALIILVLSIGYALLSQELSIHGTSQLKDSKWNIHWDNVQVNSNSVKGEAVTQAATITNTEKTLVEYSITLSEPGEFYEFTVDAKNEGTIDGMVNIVSNKTYESNGTTEKTLPAYLTYSVTYSDGKTIAPKQLLKAESTEKYKVRVEFKDVEASQLPAQEETIKFKFSVDYVQADDSAEEVVHGLTGTRYTTNLWTSGGGNDQFVRIGQKPTDNITLYETVAEARAAFNNSKMWLKHNIEMNIVKESYVCFERNNNTYCLQGGIEEEDKDTGNHPTYDKNRQVLLSVFESNQCNEYYEDYAEYDEHSEGVPGTEIGWSIHCYDGSESADASAIGHVSFYSNVARQHCNVSDDGYSGCDAW